LRSNAREGAPTFAKVATIAMNKKKKLRRTKHVIWYHNHTDRRDDEWWCVFAKDAFEARQFADTCSPYKYRDNFSMGNIYTIKEAREIYGSGWPF